MIERLLTYGFSNDQIVKLLKKKKLNTMAGEYTLKKEKLFLNGIEKVF